MATRIQAARNLIYEAAFKGDKGELDHKLTAMAKWFAGKQMFVWQRRQCRFTVVTVIWGNMMLNAFIAMQK